MLWTDGRVAAPLPVVKIKPESMLVYFFSWRTGGCPAPVDARTIVFHSNSNGYSIHDPPELYPAAGSSAPLLAAGAFFWRSEISGIEAHHAHARFAHCVRERSMS